MSKQLTLDQYGYQKRKTDSPKKKEKQRVKKEPIDDSVSEREIQSDDDLELKILRNFDLDPAYGPAIGMSRIDRWERAKNFGLNPDPTIRNLVLQHDRDESYTYSIWKKTLAS